MNFIQWMKEISLLKSTQTKQVIGYHARSGSEIDCKHFYSKLVEDYLFCKNYSDCNCCYKSVFSDLTHESMYTKSKTNHIERFNLTLRQNLSRLIRKTLSFSKSLENLEASLTIFIYDYNLDLMDGEC